MKWADGGRVLLASAPGCPPCAGPPPRFPRASCLWLRPPHSTYSLFPSVEWVPLAHRPPSYLPSEGSSVTSSLPTAAPTSLLPLAHPPHQQGPHQRGQPPVCCRIPAASLSSSPWAEGVHPGGHPLLPTLSSSGFSASPTPLFLLPQGCSPADPLKFKPLVGLSGAGHCSGAGGTACLKHARSVTPWGLRS